MIKTITLERQINNRIHRVTLTADVHLHCELIEQLINRCIRRGILIDPDALFDQVKERRG